MLVFGIRSEMILFTKKSRIVDAAWKSREFRVLEATSVLLYYLMHCILYLQS